MNLVLGNDSASLKRHGAGLERVTEGCFIHAFAYGDVSRMSNDSAIGLCTLESTWIYATNDPTAPIIASPSHEDEPVVSRGCKYGR